MDALSRLNQYARLDDLVVGLTALSCGCDDLADTVPDTHAPTPVDEDSPPAPESSRWRGTIGVEGEMTGDGRLIEPEALRWENLPIPLRYVSSDVGAHDGAVVVGRIQSITREKDGRLSATGDFDLGSEEGREAARVVGEGITNGVSMDLDDVSFEVRVAADLVEEMQQAMDGEAPDLGEPDAEGRVKIGEMQSDDEVRVTTDGRIRAATIVAIPAFESAKIELDAEQVDHEDDADLDAELVAGAAPVTPPTEWFGRPLLTGPTPLTVTEEGRVYGHLATWDTCHVAHAQQCVSPPRSNTGYAYFHTGSIMTDSGAEVPVGHITLNTRHAGEKLNPTATLSHYEDTGTAVADVVAGEDDHGIWIAGGLRSTVTPAQVRELRAAPLSGDWRRVGGNLELVAALAVNVPGFPVPRPAGMVAGGAVQSLVASGMLPPRKVLRPGTPGALSTDDLRYLKRLADRERAEEQAAQAAPLPGATDLARRVRASSLSMRVRNANGGS